MRLADIVVVLFCWFGWYIYSLYLGYMQSDVSCTRYNNVTGALTIDWVSLVYTVFSSFCLFIFSKTISTDPVGINVFLLSLAENSTPYLNSVKIIMIIFM